MGRASLTKIHLQADNVDGGRKLSATWLVICSLVTVLGFTLVCASIMLDMRHGEEEIARQSSENLVATIDADIPRNIEIYDLSIRIAAVNLMLPEVSKVSRELRHLILFDHAQQPSTSAQFRYSTHGES